MKSTFSKPVINCASTTDWIKVISSSSWLRRKQITSNTPMINGASNETRNQIQNPRDPQQNQITDHLHQKRRHHWRCSWVFLQQTQEIKVTVKNNSIPINPEDQRKLDWISRAIDDHPSHKINSASVDTAFFIALKVPNQNAPTNTLRIANKMPHIASFSITVDFHPFEGLEQLAKNQGRHL